MMDNGELATHRSIYFVHYCYFSTYQHKPILQRILFQTHYVSRIKVRRKRGVFDLEDLYIEED
jgi:hypothetical protein